MLKIRYVSSLCSENILNYIFETAKQKPEQAVQKFHRLLVDGFSNQKHCQIETFSTLPVVPSTHNKKIWNLPSETFNNIKFNYVPMLNIPIFKNIGVFIYTIFKVFFWSFFHKKDKVIICDILNVSVATASLFACKLTGAKCIAIVTDLPGLMVTNIREESNLKSYLYQKLVSNTLYRFNGYILLTQQMNDKVNPKNKPYIIMEGLVDIQMEDSTNNLNNKASEKILIYAGGLYEKYGIKRLIDGFLKVDNLQARLHLYGNGEMVDQLKEYNLKDKRIIYMGMVPNKTVVQDQLKATLLINPRPTDEEFTKYSFPSKNMEYMVSGTPMVTTKLPGMPTEYHEYVFLFKDESVEGIKNTLEELLLKSKQELHEFGAKAKDFVLKNKNNKIQTEKILKFIQSEL